MKTAKQSLFVILLCAAVGAAHGQGTPFTYQGRLNVSGSPANGLYDFTFQVFDAFNGGSSIGGTVNVNGVLVNNGLFTALVDFGGSPFTGPARWLQISVSTNGAGSFATLIPRQPLTPSPYAIYAHTAGTVTNGAIANAQLGNNAIAAANIQSNTITAGKIASGQVVKSLNGLTDAVSLTQGANVTINTVGNSLQISAPSGGLNLPFSGSASSTGSVFTLANSGSGAAGAFLGNIGIGTTAPRTKLTVWTANSNGVQEGLRINNPVGFGGSGNGSSLVFSQDRDTSENFVNASIQGAQELVDTSANAYLAFSTKSGGNVAERMRISGTGNVGIGTTAPAAKLQVSGGDAAFDSNVGIGTTTPQARLDVRGEIRLGPTGELRAPGADENLRVIRGLIAANGNVVFGSGYTVTHDSVGIYVVTFNTSFIGAPSVVATADNAFVSTSGPPQNGSVTFKVSVVELVNATFSFIAIGRR